VPAGRTDAKSPGAGREAAATAATSPATATGAATLTASLTSLLRQNCHQNSSLAAVTFALPFKCNLRTSRYFLELLLLYPFQVCPEQAVEGPGIFPVGQVRGLWHHLER
jgi:hypothetical protein